MRRRLVLCLVSSFVLFGCGNKPSDSAQGGSSISGMINATANTAINAAAKANNGADSAVNAAAAANAGANAALSAAGIAVNGVKVDASGNVNVPGLGNLPAGVDTAAAMKAAGVLTASATDCPNGNCKVDCSEAKTYDVGCAGGKCEYQVSAGATANINCTGGSCKTICAEGATCSIACPGGGCETTCAPGNKACNVTCTGGNCKSN
jgi:hypothetical protein